MNDSWKRDLKLEYAKEFTDYGCRITGNLVVVRCGEANENHPGHYEFNSQACHIVADEAERIIWEKHPGAERKLGIPDVVMLLPVIPKRLSNRTSLEFRRKRKREKSHDRRRDNH